MSSDGYHDPPALFKHDIMTLTWDGKALFSCPLFISVDNICRPRSCVQITNAFKMKMSCSDIRHSLWKMANGNDCPHNKIGSSKVVKVGLFNSTYNYGHQLHVHCHCLSTVSASTKRVCSHGNSNSPRDPESDMILMKRGFMPSVNHQSLVAKPFNLKSKLGSNLQQ